MPKLRITLVRSPIGYALRQKRTVRALGLKRLHQSVEQPDNPQIRGMARAVKHLVTVETIEDGVDAAADAMQIHVVGKPEVEPAQPADGGTPEAEGESATADVTEDATASGEPAEEAREEQTDATA